MSNQVNLIPSNPLPLAGLLTKQIMILFLKVSSVETSSFYWIQDLQNIKSTNYHSLGQLNLVTLHLERHTYLI